MKVTYSWLKELVDFPYSPDELVEVLTMLGLEVDSVENRTWDFDGMVVGRVTRKTAHQNSDKLWVCEVDIGRKRLSVVCGAPNVEVGQKVAVAPPDSRLPDGRTIRKANIRGVESEGMICSELELGLSSRGHGILVLDDDVEQGRKLRDVLGTGEVIFDLDVTPNRPDCFGVIGIAREIAAVSGGQLKKPEVKLREGNEETAQFISVEVKDAQKCPRYSARYISGVTVKDSPWWLAQRLEAVGVRAINNVVDVTNYVMLETGQPLHGFDYNLLKGQKIVVRTATEGEEFVTLDEKVHTLNSECLMICDAERPVAIGGIMGGENSEVSEETENVLLESAYFDPVNIRRTSKALGISTESSKRFERGTDPNGTRYALDRAAQLIAQLTGGTVARGAVDVYPHPIEEQSVRLRARRIQVLIGKEIPSDRVKDSLSALGFTVQEREGDAYDVRVPTFRPDITREADLIEEVARLYGYDNIEPNTSAVIEQLASLDASVKWQDKVASHLIAQGLSQVLTYCMISQKEAATFAKPEQLIALKNPLSEDLTHLRPSLLPGLLRTVRWNVNRRSPDLKLFEIGAVFDKSPKGVVEHQHLTAVFTGQVAPTTWRERPRAVDIYDVKGYLMSLLDRVFGDADSYRLVPEGTPWSTSVCLSVQRAQERVGFLGQLKKSLLEEFGIHQPVLALDLNLEKLTATAPKKVFTPIPKFPPVNRDLAVVVGLDVKAEEVLETIKQEGGEYLRQVELFDVYTGPQLQPNEKSLAYDLTFYSLERTLTEEEVDAQIESILGALTRRFGARLRT